MERKTRLVFFFIFLFLLLVSGRLATGSFAFLVSDFWFAAGLLLLLLGSLIEQPFFSTDSEILINGVGAATSLLAVPKPDRMLVWWFFLIWSLYLVASSYALLWLRSRPLREEGTVVRFVTRFNRRIGSPQVLFSAFFVWGAVIQLGLGSQGFSVLFIYWAVFLLIDVVGLGKSIEGWLQTDSDDPCALGRITAVIEPNVVMAEIAPEADLDTFQIVSLGIPSRTELARGYVIDERRLRNKRLGNASACQLGELER